MVSVGVGSGFPEVWLLVAPELVPGVASEKVPVSEVPEPEELSEVPVVLPAQPESANRSNTSSREVVNFFMAVSFLFCKPNFNMLESDTNFF